MYVFLGPFAFVWEGVQYLAYSAAGSWCTDYCIALMQLTGDDPLNPDHWEKNESPVFSGNDKVKGAGHCSIVCHEDKLHVFFRAWDANENDINWRNVATWHGIMEITPDGAIIK